MEKIQTARQAEHLLNKGETKEAIELLLNFLESYEAEQTQLYKEIIQIKAQFLRAKRHRSMGIISVRREEEVLEEVKTDLRGFLDRVSGKAPMLNRSRWLNVPAYAYWLGILGAILLTFFTFYITKQTAIKKATAHCPVFADDADFKILILPLSFQNDRSDRPMHQRVKDNFQLYVDSMNLNISIGLSELGWEEERYPQDMAEAMVMAEDCGAQLVMWGDNDFVYYKFTDQNENFKFYQLCPDQGDEMLPVPIEVPIATSGKISKQSDPSVLNYLLGTAVNQIEDYSSAVQLLRTPLIDSSDHALVLLRALQLADSEMEVNNFPKAIEAYDVLLSLHPNYDFARLNRAVLYSISQSYKNAIRDFNMLIAAYPKNHLAHYAKGRTLARMDQFKEAELELNLLDSLITQDSSQYMLDFKNNVLGKTRSDLAKKKYEIQKALRLSRQKLREQPDDIELKNIVLRYFLQLGEDEKAREMLDEGFEITDLKTLEMIKARSLALNAMKQTELALFWQGVIPPDFLEVRLAVHREDSVRVL